MITREPKIGDKIEYRSNDYANWEPAGEVVQVIDDICYTFDPNSKMTHKQHFGCSPVPAGCEKSNNGFIWRFHDMNNKLHRIVE